MPGEEKGKGVSGPHFEVGSSSAVHPKNLVPSEMLAATDPCPKCGTPWHDVVTVSLPDGKYSRECHTCNIAWFI